MDVREQLELAYMKDKHSSVRVVFQETKTIAKIKEASGHTPVFCAVMALYVMDLNILCVDAKVLTNGVMPAELRGPKFEMRVLETHEFPAAVRRAVELATEIPNKLREPVDVALGDRFVVC